MRTVTQREIGQECCAGEKIVSQCCNQDLVQPATSLAAVVCRLASRSSTAGRTVRRLAVLGSLPDTKEKELEKSGCKHSLGFSGVLTAGALETFSSEG